MLYLRAGISHLHCAAHQWRSERADAESRPRIQVMADREIGLLDSLTAERYYKVCRRGGRARLGVDVTVIRTPLSMCCMDTWYM